MAICREFYFPSSDGSSRIHAAEWTPESGEIIGVLQIAHGVAEYGMRYAPFAEFMTEHGFAVVANDHLGHGLSAEKDADTLFLARATAGSMLWTTCTPCAAARRKNIPMFPIFSWATRWARS